MKRRALKIIFGLLLFCAVGLAAVFYFSREPVYEGRPLSAWVAELNHRDYEKQKAAAEAVKAIGSKAVPYLSSEVEQRENWLQRSARKIAKNLPERVKAVGRKLAPRKTAMDRVAAAKALQILGTNATDAVSALTNALREPDVLVAQQASYALATMPSAVPALITALDDGDFAVRSQAALALRTLGPAASNAVPRLHKIICEEPGAIVTLASYALSGIGQPAIPALTNTLLLHTNASIRKLTATTLGAMDIWGMPAVPALSQAVKDTNSAVRQAALWAIGKIDRSSPEAEVALLEALKDSSQTNRTLAMEALVHRAHVVHTNLAFFEALTNDANLKVREGARTAITWYKDILAENKGKFP